MIDGLETPAERAFVGHRDTPLSVKTLALVVALLGLTTGCSVLHPAASPAPVAAESDPWVGFNNGYETKKEEPKHEEAKKEEPKSDDKRPDEKAAEKSEKSEKVASADDDEDEAPKAKPKKLVAKKKPAKKKPAGATVATKKPRKRAKKPS